MFSVRGDKIFYERVFCFSAFLLFHGLAKGFCTSLLCLVLAHPKRLIVGLATSVAAIFPCVSFLCYTAAAGNRLNVDFLPDPSKGKSKQAKPFPFFCSALRALSTSFLSFSMWSLPIVLVEQCLFPL